MIALQHQRDQNVDVATVAEVAEKTASLPLRMLAPGQSLTLTVRRSLPVFSAHALRLLSETEFFQSKLSH